MKRERETQRFEYEGPVYVRPIMRGIVLEEKNTYLDDEIQDLVGGASVISNGWKGRLRILVDVLEEDEA